MHFAQVVYVYSSAPWQFEVGGVVEKGEGLGGSRGRGFLRTEKKACCGVKEVRGGKRTIPSEQAAQCHREECRQQEVGDSVEVERREGHHSNGQGERPPGGQGEEFTARDQETGVEVKTRMEAVSE